MTSHGSVSGRLLARALRATGRAGDVDPDLPARFVVEVARHRAIEAARGLVRTRSLVFLGPGTVLRNERGIAWGSAVSIGRGCDIDGWSRDGVRFGDASRIGRWSVVTSTSHVSRLGRGFTLGARSALGDYCHVGASGGVVIGEDVITGSYVSFHSQNHVFSDSDKPIKEQGTTEAGIVVEDGCWLGAKVTVLDGSLIGSRSVVAAGAVVHGRFPPRSLLAGVPARRVRTI